MPELLGWLREQFEEYVFDVTAVYSRLGDHEWPWSPQGNDPAGFEAQLDEAGHLLPLPREPAALANVIEVSVVDFLLERVTALEGANARRGTERGYPDIEVEGPAFGGGFHAVDVKVARLANSGRQTQSRITLYTGNTFFRWPELHWPGTFRPFNDYESHLDVICLYKFNEDLKSRVEQLEVIVQPPWSIGSKQRSSTTREYLGAVMALDALREGRGEFETPEAFYDYWRKFAFRTGKAVESQLRRLLNEQAKPKE